MTGQRLRRCTGAVLILGSLAFVWVTRGPAGESVPVAGAVRIGMLGALLKEVPDPLLAAMQQPFNTMMAQQTGLNGELVRSGGADQLARQLAGDKVQLGIFYGIDFAWVRTKHPELKPLMICINKHSELWAHLLVRADSKAAGFADLQGKVVTLPKTNPHHCMLFFQGLCHARNISPEQFAAKLVPSEDFEESLDQVVDGAAQAAVVDAVSLECFQRRKPGRFAKLKVLEKSVAFPCACVAYHSANGLDAVTLKRFKHGMLNANQTYLGKRMFTLFKMTAFQSVPHNYEQHLQEIVKAYPAPAELESPGQSPKP